MAKELFAKARKIVPFEQNGAFFHKKARKHIENNNYINALSYYRKAVEKDPDNVEYLLDLAEVFTEMSYFTESNQILFGIVQQEAARGDCYFGIGCNFLGLQDYDKAEEWLVKYLDIEEDGIYAEEAQDLLDVLQSQEFYLDKYDDMDPTKEQAFKTASKGKDHLDRGEYARAVKALEKVAAEEPSLIFARNNLALAYFCVGRLEKALDTTYDILRDHPGNVHANCNAALFHHEQGNQEYAEKYLRTILSLPAEDPEEIHKIAVTLCELKQHERVNQMLKTLLRYKPYDAKILHYMAVSCFNLKQYRSALKYWEKIEKINPDNTISAFYQRHTENVLKDSRSVKELPYHFQVPYDEIIRRVKKINDLLKLPSGDLAEKWRLGDNLRTLLLWGLDLNDAVIKKAILNVVASFGDKKSERFLRDFVLRKQEGAEEIREALKLLKQMNAEEPYIAYVDNNIVEVKVSIRERCQSKGLKVLRAIPQFTVDNMLLRYPQDFEEEVRALWQQITAKIPEETLLRRKMEGWAAALELLYATIKGIPASKRQLSQLYRVGYTTLMKAYTMMEAALDMP